MIGDAFFRAMKSDALLVNAGRGGVVDTDALISALHSGKVRAVLDVTDPEPLPADHPLRNAPNVLISPHVAGLVGGARRWTTEVILAQLERFARGEALENVVIDGY
jgi:phosphoglycerate dehydrogenase-like enzyme